MQSLADSISTAFDSVTTANARSLVFQFYISWIRNLSNNLFGVVGTSTVNNALVRGETTVLTPIDAFEFVNETDQVISLEYDRFIQEPLGGISFGIMNVILDNTDKRFTPNFDSTIGTAILPNRPTKMAIGFNVRGINKSLIVFKGLSNTIQENKGNRTVMFSGFDYVSYLNELDMDSQIYTDQRSDQIIEQLLIEAGLGTSQYQLDQGLNTIGFAWFKSGQKAGDRIRQICEAEEANFYQDENGVIRFENRRKYNLSPYNTIVWTINKDDILEWAQDRSVKIVNKCVVTGTPRTTGDKTEIWKDGIVEEVACKGEIERWAKFDNPAISIDDLVANTDYKANTASDGTGTDITSSVSIVLEGFTETAKLTITNNAGQKAYITFLRLMGIPAVETSKIAQEYSDATSIKKYDEKLLTIENDYIDDDTFAYYLARTIVGKYKDPLKRITIRVRGIPRLQLKDKVRVYDQDLSEYKNYRVMRIQGIMALGGFEQVLTLREVTDEESDSWATVGVTTVEETQEVVGI